MDNPTYARTVRAALAETKSKFELAEALALEIPERQAGRQAEGTEERPVPARLEEAREAIIQAGGEPRSVDTLANYRHTALWVGIVPGTEHFRWVPGASFTAHNEARGARMSYEEFAALEDKTSTAIRVGAGNRGSHGGPGTIDSWTPDQQAEAARHLMARPGVADAVAADPAAASHAAEAIRRQQDKARAERPVRETPERPDPVHEVMLELAAYGEGIRRDVDGMLGILHRDDVTAYAAVREYATGEADFMAEAARLIREAASGTHSMDDALSAMLRNEEGK